MTPRGRALAAIEHQPTDRAPADYGAHKSVTDGPMAKLGVADQEELLRALGVDLRGIGFNYYHPRSEPDADGCRRDMRGARRLVGEPTPDRPASIWPCHVRG
jgi:hypothetical protein